MPPCCACQQPATKRNGGDRRTRQKCASRACRRTFPEGTVSAFSWLEEPRDGWGDDPSPPPVRHSIARPDFAQRVRSLLVEPIVEAQHVAVRCRQRRHPGRIECPKGRTRAPPPPTGRGTDLGPHLGTRGRGWDTGAAAVFPSPSRT